MGTSPLGVELGAQIVDVELLNFDMPVGTHDLSQFHASLSRKDRSQETRAQNRLYRRELWSNI